MELPYSVYIFDFDGTVANTCEDVWGSVEYACEQCSITIPCDIRRNAGNLALPTKELYRLLKGKSDNWEEKRFAELIRIHYRTINSFPFTSLYPGMKEILDELSGKTTCFLASNKAEPALRRLIKNKQWGKYFERAYGTLDDGSRIKTDMIRLIIENFPEKEKTDFIYIGDTYTDIVAARENGIAAAGVTYGDGDAEKLMAERPDYVAHTCRELYDFLICHGNSCAKECQ
ncbi:MAG: HAD hydrolase-like protein [Hungatella hathewayi]|uniref:HAD family hydrolase n=1 Tax=Hungatella TaxID=1649459 RepID=UPI0011067019|nr:MULTISPECIES: HAD hydrolase-like protein [Hungatella]MCI7382364.1 HAD hydrolase-like protein [Hungatella sp.]MDY6239537.1 HAD hydrolase-like protein [Hungatella hathewayi]